MDHGPMLVLCRIGQTWVPALEEGLIQELIVIDLAQSNELFQSRS
jgi:hypothetical protein